MKSLKQQLKEKYNLSNYQIAQLIYFGKTLSSEMSKILIMGIIFHKYLSLYIFTLMIMIILRYSTGGIHFCSYVGCLLTSITYVGLSIILLPQIIIPLNIKIFLLIICILICYYIGPVPSKYRTSYSKQFINKCKKIISTFIFLYTLILYIIPESPFSISGFWIIMLHTLQLSVAKYTRKENPK